MQLDRLQLQTILGGRYRLEREIGQGGMAIVYLARDLQLERDVAVKVLLGELAFAMGPERFRREIEVVSRLHHPHILSIEDYGDHEGHLYYVMPFIAGETLHARLLRERQLPVDVAVRLASEIGSALDHAHREGIVHRDIKPENILLNNNSALVADFGIARAITEGGGEKLTRTGITLGTPTYMSPEQAMADPVLDGRSDVYSLGCVLYEMLAGTPPFSGPTAQAIIARHQLDEAPSLSIVRGTIPEELEDIVMQALAKLPADRFATAGEFSQELQASTNPGMRSSKRITVGRRRTPTQQRRAAKARKRKLMIAAAVGVPLLAVVGFATAHFRASPAKSRIGTDSDPNHIAVTYFEDQSDGGKLRFLADGFTEALIDEIGHVPQLHVISRNGVAPYKSKNVAPDSLQRALKVGTLVSGTVAQSGELLRVKVTLVDALTGEQIDSKTIEKPRAEIFQLQDELAKEVSQHLRKAVGREVEGMTSRRGTSNAAAWEGLLRARQTLAGVDTMLAGGDVKGAVRRLAFADSELTQASSLDGKWADPVVARGFIQHRKVVVLGLGSGDASQVPKWLDSAGTFADQALSLAPTDADALELRATVHYFSWLMNLAPDPAASGQLIASAERDFRASVKANPLQATAWNTFSHLLLAKSQTAEAKLAAQSAYDADPYLTDVDKTIWRLFQSSLDLNERTEAEKWCATGQKRFPDNYRFTECRLWLFTLEGKKPNVDSLWSAYHAYVTRSPANLQGFDALKGGMITAIGLIRAGLPDSARTVAVRARGTPQIDPAGELTYLEAIVRAQVGDKDDAIRLITRFLAANPQQRAFAGHDESWWLDNLRDDPRYRALVGPAS